MSDFNAFLPVIANAANAVLGAVPIVKEGISELLHCRLNVAVLDAAALIVSILRRDFRTAGLLVLLLGMGDMLEKYARKKSMASLAEQLSVKCDRVWVRTPDGLRQKFLETVTRDDVGVVRAGSVIPVDGVVADGEAAVNQASMTGEPLAVARNAGGSVFAGTVVESGEIGISPTGVGDGTRLAKIIKFVEDSEQVKAGIESRALRFADAVVPFNFALAALVWLFTRTSSPTIPAGPATKCFVWRPVWRNTSRIRSRVRSWPPRRKSRYSTMTSSTMPKSSMWWLTASVPRSTDERCFSAPGISSRRTKASTAPVRTGTWRRWRPTAKLCSTSPSTAVWSVCSASRIRFGRKRRR